jgi:hypothetical protein
MPVATAHSPAPTPTPTLSITSPADAYRRALRLGFTFPQIAGGDGTRVALGPVETPLKQAAEVRAVREFISRNETQVLAIAEGKSALARPSESPRKIGIHPFTGQPLDPVELPEPEPPPPPSRTSVLVDDIGALRTYQECDAAIAVVDNALRVAQWFMDHLPAEAEAEDHAVFARRQNLYHQIGLLTDHRWQLSQRRSELFMQHVDAAALDRERMVGPRVLTPGWELGPRR